MIGYEAFNSDWTCIGFQYQIGQTFRMKMIYKSVNQAFIFAKFQLIF
jgi:hypothetical protein